MTEDELAQIVDAKLADALAARLEADRARVRADVIAELRRAEERAWYDRVNRRHPIEDKYSGLGAEGHAARIAAMRIGAARDAAHMAEVNSRPIPGSLVHQRKQAALTPGSEGFKFK
jgi:hypothetical protein